MAYDPGRGGLVCAFCGATRAVGEGDEERRIVEYDLESGLARAAQRGYGTEVRSLACQQCGAVVSYRPADVARRCDFCASPQVSEQSAREQPIRPESVVPFRIDRRAAADTFSRWLGGLWFRPSDLQRLASISEMTGMYVPYWSFDADVHSDWTALAGYYYYETERYRTRDARGQLVERERRVRRVRWQPAWGSRDDRYDDLLVCASRGLPRELTQRLEPFETRELEPYDADYLAGWRAEAYSVELNTGWKLAVERIVQSQRERCARDVPGDTQRDLHVADRFSQQKFKHLLLPIWISAYRYRGKPYQFLVNGQTGEVTGHAPWSVLKIALASLLGALALLIFLYLQR